MSPFQEIHPASSTGLLGTPLVFNTFQEIHPTGSTILLDTPRVLPCPFRMFSSQPHRAALSSTCFLVGRRPSPPCGTSASCQSTMVCASVFVAAPSRSWQRSWRMWMIGAESWTLWCACGWMRLLLLVVVVVVVVSSGVKRWSVCVPALRAEGPAI